MSRVNEAPKPTGFSRGRDHKTCPGRAAIQELPRPVVAFASFVLVAVMAMYLSGCFWILRVPFPTEEKFSDEGVRTNCVWRAPIRDFPNAHSWTNWTVYPLVGLRVYATYHLSDNDDIPLEELPSRFPDRHYDGRDLNNIKWQRRMRCLQYVVLWAGVPIDAVVDTVMLPFDLWP